MSNLKIGSSTFNNVKRVQFCTPEDEIVSYTSLEGLQEKSATLDGDGVYNIYPDEGIDGMKHVQVTVRNTGNNLNVQGVIEQYKVAAGEEVSAGQFVEFVNQFGTGEVVSANTNYFSACLLDNTRVLLAYGLYMDSGTYQAHAKVISIEGGVITEGNIVRFNSFTATEDVVALTLAPNSAVVLYWSEVDKDFEYAYLSINGNVISVLKDGDLAEDIGVSNTSFQALSLSNNRILVAYRNDNYEYVRLYYLTQNVVQELDSFYRTFMNLYHIKLEKINNNKIAIAEQGSDGRHFLTMVGIENNQISVGGAFEVGTVNAQYVKGKNYSINRLCEDTLLFCLIGSSVDAKGWIYRLDGTAPTLVESFYFDSGTLVKGSSIGVLTLDESRVALCCSSAVTSKIRIFNWKTKTYGDWFVFDESSAYSHLILPFSDSSFLNLYCNAFVSLASFSVNGTIVTRNTLTTTCVQPATSRLHNVGVAKDAGIEGQSIGVYCVPTL